MEYGQFNPERRRSRVRIEFAFMKYESRRHGDVDGWIQNLRVSSERGDEEEALYLPMNEYLITLNYELVARE